MGADKVLVLSDGDVAGLAACATVRDATAARPGAPSDWPQVMSFPFSDGRLPRRERAVMRQAEALSFRICPPAALPDTHAGTVGELEARDLLAAVYSAARQGCGRVIWPASAARGEDLDIDRIAQIADRALLVARLVAIDGAVHGEPGITIETPYLDLTDRQIADLAADVAAPVEHVWWNLDGGRGAEESAEAARWGPAFEAVGWPLKVGAGPGPAR
jgi:hypothetical protein